MTKDQNMPTTTDRHETIRYAAQLAGLAVPARPIDVAPDPVDAAWCSCGRRIWGHDRAEFAMAWYGHLLDMVRSDPESEHRMEYPF